MCWHSTAGFVHISYVLTSCEPFETNAYDLAICGNNAVVWVRAPVPAGRLGVERDTRDSNDTAFSFILSIHVSSSNVLFVRVPFSQELVPVQI